MIALRVAPRRARHRRSLTTIASSPCSTAHLLSLSHEQVSALRCPLAANGVRREHRMCAVASAVSHKAGTVSRSAQSILRWAPELDVTISVLTRGPARAYIKSLTPSSERDSIARAPEPRGAVARSFMALVSSRVSDGRRPRGSPAAHACSGHAAHRGVRLTNRPRISVAEAATGRGGRASISEAASAHGRPDGLPGHRFVHPRDQPFVAARPAKVPRKRCHRELRRSTHLPRQLQCRATRGQNGC